MYIPKSFKLENKNLLNKIISDFPFATLISNNRDGIQITHLPLILNEKENLLIGHMAKANNQLDNMENMKVISIFHGPHTYISLSFYETLNTVPTWDYVNIHIHGILSITNNEEMLMTDLNTLIEKFEPKSEIYSMNSVEPKNLERLISGIIGFRIKIENIEAKAKLNQNHSIERQKLLAQKLKLSGKENDLYISELIESNLRTYE
jgi:transcriptional regulator